MIHDARAQAAIAGNINMLVPWYLMASYMYYIRDYSLLSDGYFDQLCEQLRAAWDRVEHFHKHLVNIEDLSAGTCLRTDFPLRVQGAAHAVVDLPPWQAPAAPPKPAGAARKPLKAAVLEAPKGQPRRGWKPMVEISSREEFDQHFGSNSAESKAAADYFGKPPKKGLFF